MQTTLALVALASVAFAQSTPSGCSASYDGDFQITVVNGTAVAKRDASTCGQEGLLTAKLANGVLTDSKSRVGSVVSNYQFQFDGPPAQAGALFADGFSVCSNGTLARGDSALWYSCASGDFSNLYDRSWAPQCEPVFIYVLPCGASGGVGQQPDGQPTFTSAAPAVSQIADGQPQLTGVAAPPVTQINDGQLQIPTAVSQIGDGQIQGPTKVGGAPVTQITDGQIQAPTQAPATQISDGQVQVPTTAGGAPVSQISDGQVQVPTAAPTLSPVASSPSNATITRATTVPTVIASAANALNIAASMAALVGLSAVFLL